MIEIIYYREHFRVTVKGHAGTAPKGEDLVCAAVSALTYTLAANARNLCEIGASDNFVCKLGSGDAEVSFRPKARARSTCGLVMRAVCAGFSLIAEKYPEAVHYEIHGG